MFSLNDLETLEELREGVESIGQTARDFRHCHIVLKDELGEEEHAKVYPDFEEVLKKVRDYQKEAKAKIRNLSKVTEDPLAAARRKLDEDKEIDRKETEGRVRKNILIEENVFREKLDAEINDMDNDNLLSIEKYCVPFEHLLDNYYALLSKAKVAFSNDYDLQCKDIFDKTVSDIRNQIKSSKTRMAELVTSQKEQLAKELENKEKAAAETLKREQMSVALILSQEIEARSTNIVEKCDSSKLSDFDDFRVWECSKNLFGIDREVREIYSKFTEFSKISSVHCDETDPLVVKTSKVKDNAIKTRNSYAIKLHEIITQRDISEEKLKKSSLIPIELSKF